MYLIKNGWKFRNAAVDSYCKQITRCIRANGRAHVFRPSTNCCCGWSVSGKEFGVRKFCRQVRIWCRNDLQIHISFPIQVYKKTEIVNVNNVIWASYSQWLLWDIGNIRLSDLRVLASLPRSNFYRMTHTFGNLVYEYHCKLGNILRLFVILTNKQTKTICFYVTFFNHIHEILNLAEQLLII